MKQRIFVLFLIFSTGAAFAQERKDVKQGNKAYKTEDYVTAETDYRRALEKNNHSFEANYNLGNSLYKQEKYNEAFEAYKKANSLETEDKEKISATYHNLGNALLSAQQFQESIDAYKMALKNNPQDDETRYNLAYAQTLLQKQQQQQQDQDNNQDEEDSILKRAKELIAQRKYQDAHDLLQKSNPTKYGDFMERIMNVIKMN